MVSIQREENAHYSKVAHNLRGRLICKHSCIMKCHLIQYDTVTMWYTMKYFMFEVTDYVGRTKVTLPWLLPYLSQNNCNKLLGW